MSTAATFKQDVIDYLIANGAKPFSEELRRLLYDYALPTTLGELWVTPHDDRIVCRWGNVKKALAAGLEVNPYTGEWNFHLSTYQCRNAPTAALFLFQAELSEFLPNATAPA